MINRKLKNSMICLLLTGMVLCGCSGSSREAEASLSGDKSVKNSGSNSKINITFAQWSVPSAGLINEALKDFNDNNDQNIHVELIKVPLDRYIETLNMLNTSGQAPDVYELIEEWLTSYVNNNFIADLTDFVDQDFVQTFPYWMDDYTKVFIKEDGIYSFPSSQITYRLIYNKELFESAGLNPEKPPRTLEDLKSCSKMISDSEKGQRKYGFALPMGEEWMDFVQPMEAVNSYSGISFFNFEKGKYDLTVYQPWLTAIRELDQNETMFPGMRTMKSELAMAQFAEGNIGMMYAASWQASLLFNQLQPKFDWGVATPPALKPGSAGKGKVSVKLSGWNVVSSTTKHKEEAFKVWEYLYSDKFQSFLFQHGSAIPLVNITGAEQSFIQDKECFDHFLPDSNDDIYPETPMVMDEWTRMKAYLESLNSSQMEDILLEESNRLNNLLSTYLTGNSIRGQEYNQSLFTPVNPKK